MNEKTETQIEAAAKIIRRESATIMSDPGDFWSDCYESEQDEWRSVARAALVAAQGAAPQTEALPETGNEIRDEDGDLISSGKHLRVLHQGGYVCDTCTNVLGINVRWDHAVKRNDHAPVLPSSGVDEDKLAEVIDKALIRHGEMAGMSNQERWDARDDIARAVAEWLEGQGQ